MSPSILERIVHYALIAFALLTPISVAGGNLLAAVLIFLWFMQGNFRIKINKLSKNKFAIASLAIFIIYFIGILWTSDYHNGFEKLKKMIEFGILIPILLTLIKEKKSVVYLNAFFFSIAITLIVSFALYFGFINEFAIQGVLKNNPTPFMSHITHTPLMAISFYISARLLLSNTINSFIENKFYNITILLISLLSALNVLITSGRAGHIVFLALTILLIFQIIKKPIVSLLISITSISLILLFSSIFEFNFSYKLNKTIENLSMNESSSSLARRYYMAENSMEIFQNNFLFGVGSGDFYSEYEKIKSKKNYPFELASTKNPHNMYLLVAAELGIFGLIFLFYFFYVLFKSALLQKNIFYKDSAIALGLSFCILNLSDSYFLGHFSTFIFALLISIFFADIYE